MGLCTSKLMITAILVVAVCLLPGFSANAYELRTAAQDSPPKYFMEEDQGLMQGLCIDILDALENANLRLTFTGQNEFMHTGRIYSALHGGSLDLFCGSGKTPDREGRFDYLPIPLYPVNSVLVGRAGDQVEVNSFSQLHTLENDNVLITYLNSASHRFLTRQQNLNIEAGSDLRNLFDRLLRGRGRFIFYHDLGLYHFIASHHLQDKVRVLPASLRTYHHYIVLSKKLPLEVRNLLLKTVGQLQQQGQPK
ncbi:MAG: ABC transporter substrate-binding protein [Motiliproteus sp.]|nr:ABC transporter substrate-binding protein [Motiliproteus sp.]MCW9052092.1 ABC transporter substrate-binding protein [Motiliproteus sp.]